MSELSKRKRRRKVRKIRAVACRYSVNGRYIAFGRNF